MAYQKVAFQHSTKEKTILSLNCRWHNQDMDRARFKLASDEHGKKPSESKRLMFRRSAK